jgi:thiamine-monophosphate kinase
MQGAQECCKKYGAAIIGGDIDRHGELTIVTTGLGLVEKDYIVRRKGAQPGDLICVTGTLGQAQARLDGYLQFEKALFEPQPRVEEGQRLGRADVSSMMDDSDGIALSLYDLANINGCGFAIDTKKLPLAAGIPLEQAREFALHGGGDYELIFTLSPDKFPVAGVPSTVIGNVVAEKRVTADGITLAKRGYQHRWE